MNTEDVPGRVFLDTSVVNFWMDHGQEISEGTSSISGLPEVDVADINALHCIHITGKRAGWQLAVSPHTYQEVVRTSNVNRREYLERWFLEIWDYWQGIIRDNSDLPTFTEAEATRVRILSSGVLDTLPDLADRILVVDAIVYRCDVFCTRDRRTIIKHRDDLSSVGIPILTPSEWWEMIKPYAALWW